MKRIFIYAAFVAVMAVSYSCVKQKSTSEIIAASESIAVKVEKPILENLVDSLLNVYPKTFENPIQQSDFLVAIEKTVRDLSPSVTAKMIEQIPFKLDEIRSASNQTDNKYLTSFEFSEIYNMNKEPEGEYATIDEGYGIQVYIFPVFDKAVASQLEKNIEYMISGKPQMLENPTIGGWNERTVTLGFGILEPSIKEFDKN